MIEENQLQQQFQLILEQHKGVFFKVAQTYCSNESDRQDLIQEIMIQVWKSLGKYNNKYAITTWLYRIAINVAISFYRKNKHVKLITNEINEQQVQHDESHLKEKEQQLLLLEQFINELNEFDKALMLLYLDQRPHSEIATILGISVSNVSTKTARIKEKLRNRFAQIKL